jgi:hypothetical protein
MIPAGGRLIKPFLKGPHPKGFISSKSIEAATNPDFLSPKANRAIKTRQETIGLLHLSYKTG